MRIIHRKEHERNLSEAPAARQPPARSVDVPVLVALWPCPEYEPALLQEGVALCSRMANLSVRHGDKVLVKPNLVSARKSRLSCTHPEIVRAVCCYLLDHGASVHVGDSPAFGSARQVARAAGITAALKGLPVTVRNLDHPVKRRLACGTEIGISRSALDCDILFNLPKLKAHGQLFISAAAKNLFGCVSGVRKALAHVRHQHGDDLAGLILDLQDHLPATFNLIDAVTAMHGTGPVSGTPCRLKLLGAANNAVALDTALYTALGLESGQVPFWREARRKNLPGSIPAHLTFPLHAPEELRLPRFQTPQHLKPVSFHPWQITRSMCKRAWLGITDWTRTAPP